MLSCWIFLKDFHQHRQQDFTFILDGVFHILELQMASLNNYLPGARKSVLYIVETSGYMTFRILCMN